MDQQGPQRCRTNLPGQRCVLDPAGARGPTADPAPAAAPPHLSAYFLDGEKTGAALLFSGICLALVGITFTAMGWQRYQVNPHYEWPQLLGPIMISVGGMFVLTSVCRFGVISCRLCRQRDQEVLVMPAREQTLTGSSFTLSSISQPIMLHGATTMLCIPPPYNLITQEDRQAADLQPVTGVLAALPPLGAVYSVDNAAFTTEEDGSAHSTGTDRRRSRIERREDERRQGDGGATRARPPAYEDIYPSLSGRHSP
ncbi:transmembrane protein 174 [Aulostomus maculatus]